MARMHSRKKGKSGSARPHRTESPEWVEFTGEEVEEMVVKLANEGKKPSDIGATMRDQNGVPSVKLTSKKRVTQILAENDLTTDYPEDLLNLITRAVTVDKHMKANPKDQSSKYGLQLIESKIRRLIKYYKAEKRIPADWKYNLKTAKLLVK
ncbi:MAG: 30S ribosomal protein S15 [Candidatus Hydrothermarchaeales archaeon]